MLNAMKKSLGKNLFGRSSRKKNHSSNNEGSFLSRSRSDSAACSSVSDSQAEVLQNREEMEEVFKKFDANGDGKISKSELADILRSMGSHVGEEELEIMMEEADADGDGFISLQEFIDLNTVGNDREACLEDLKNAFNMFDLDKNGSISADELYQVLRRMGEGSSREECLNMISRVDRNGDGLVNFEEFLRMMTSNPK